jgi:DNA-binding IclR family transcriptional regulator
VGAVVNAMKILRYLGAQSGPVSVTQMARDTGLSASTCFTIARTLWGGEFIAFDPDRKVYAIGHGIREIAGSAQTSSAAQMQMRQVMEALATENNVTVSLWRRVSADRKLLVYCANPLGDMTVFMRPGRRRPLLGGAVGKIVVAHGDLTPGEVRSQFKAIRWWQAPSLAEFLEQSALAKKAGWAIDRGELGAGVATIAVPVLGKDGSLHAVCTATMLMEQFEERRAKPLAQELIRIAARLTTLGVDP